MPFWHGVPTALGREGADLEGGLGDRIVEDSLVRAAVLRTRTVLLCESPHHTEISYGHPLARDSGKTVKRVFASNLADFNGQEELIGCLLHRCLQGVNANPGLFIPYTVHRRITPQLTDLALQDRIFPTAIISTCETKDQNRQKINELGTLRSASTDQP